MPTERFYHLSDEKKKLIKEAAIKEFCRVPLEKASINKIVQNAAISRGSFYTYFSDKEDILEYIFEELISKVQEFCKKILSEEKGDFWELPVVLLDYLIDLCEGSQIFSLAQSRAGNQIIGKLLDGKSGIGCCCPPLLLRKDRGKKTQSLGTKETVGNEGVDYWIRELYQIADCSALKVNSLEDFQALFSLCILNMMMTIGEIYQKGINKKVAKAQFAKRLEIIKYGGASKSS